MYFSISSMKITGREKMITKNQSLWSNGVVENIVFKNGMYNIRQCNSVDINIAPHNHKLLNIPIVNKP